MAGGRAEVDLASETGGKVRIFWSNARDGAEVTVTIEAYGDKPPFRKGETKVEWPSYYDVKVEGIADGIASICLASTSGKDPTVMRYRRDDGVWLYADHLEPSGKTITGEIQVPHLHGSPIIIGT